MLEDWSLARGTVSSTLSLDPKTFKIKANMDTLSRLKDFDFELWTDGSFISELGAGAVQVYMKGREEPIYQASAPSGYLSSSYRAEMVAIYLISEKCAGTLLVASDSQSSITALEAAPPPPAK